MEFQVTSLRYSLGNRASQDVLRKAVPEGLKPQEVERNSTHKAPCPYIPEQDEVEAKLELKTQYAKFTQPNGVELKHPVYDGVGNREKFLTHTSFGPRGC